MAEHIIHEQFYLRLLDSSSTLDNWVEPARYTLTYLGRQGCASLVRQSFSLMVSESEISCGLWAIRTERVVVA